ncbi:MAG: hypothetical protein WCV88_06115 [Patescibacteria group bacterium]|jgi:hypothetical protein
MDNVQEKVEELENPTPEAIQAEEKALTPEAEEKVRSQVIEKYGLDPDLQADLIDSLVKDKVEEHKRFSTAVKQKRSWREKALKQPEVKTEVKTEVKAVDDSLISQKVAEQLDQRDLESLELSDEIKSEIKNYAKLNNISVKVAAQSDYIGFLKTKAAEKAKVEGAGIGGVRKTQPTKDFSDKTPNDFDLSTEDGRKEWEEYKRWQKSQ